ncbi:MAG: hypothetical protein IT331_11430 [Anaerolineae bacterium]|nr:hypothetical protein [Anaerolineae bacterium]
MARGVELGSDASAVPLHTDLEWLVLNSTIIRVHSAAVLPARKCWNESRYYDTHLDQ